MQKERGGSPRDNRSSSTSIVLIEHSELSADSWEQNLSDDLKGTTTSRGSSVVTKRQRSKGTSQRSANRPSLAGSRIIGSAKRARRDLDEQEVGDFIIVSSGITEDQIRTAKELEHLTTTSTSNGFRPAAKEDQANRQISSAEATQQARNRVHNTDSSEIEPKRASSYPPSSSGESQQQIAEHSMRNPKHASAAKYSTGVADDGYNAELYTQPRNAAKQFQPPVHSVDLSQNPQELSNPSIPANSQQQLQSSENCTKSGNSVPQGMGSKYQLPDQQNPHTSSQASTSPPPVVPLPPSNSNSAGYWTPHLYHNHTLPPEHSPTPSLRFSLPPQYYQSAVAFTIDNHAQSALSSAAVQALFEIFSGNAQVLLRPKETPTRDKIYPVGSLMWQNLPGFCKWYTKESGTTEESVLRFELLDIYWQPKKVFLFPGGNLYYFQVLKQYIWDYFWVASNLNSAPSTFRILIRAVGHVTSEAPAMPALPANFANTRMVGDP